jgi:S1-C subfamily serine protease
MLNLDLLDFIIIFFILSTIFRGYIIGFVRQFFATTGFFSGILLGAWIASFVVKTNGTQLFRSILTLLITMGAGLLFLAIGEIIGDYIKHKIRKHHFKRFDLVDSIFGSILGGIGLLVYVWLVASILIKLPYPTLKSQIQQSSIVARLNKNLPPAPGIITKLGSIIDPNGFPEVFLGTEPAPPSPVKLPTVISLQAITDQDSKSVVKIEGRGCGGIVLGSGFVASQNIIVTNAHVVAGVASPYIDDQNGKHLATTIFFDPNLDLAVLRSVGVTDAPLKINTLTQINGITGIVMGYPGGGNLTVSTAAVLDSFIATGRNIYNQGSTDRGVYELQTDVQPGNSGGPFITRDGQVSGIVFAQSTVYNHVGYALTMQQVQQELHQAEANPQQTADTGACAE